MINRRTVTLGLGSLPLLGLASTAQAASTASEINKDSTDALKQLYRLNPVAESIASKALGILIFPKIVKAGFIFGGSYGEGVLR